ncbi:acyl-CoA dehydrogenase family protein [Halococcus qingdaonensis]|uniref:acyl-CoA dehydrogenase family protein n=1 Tax=Halococcus qingdaonensis TaxID=224402 RepID=UPI0021171096|nr:acyl-CoA dehydrogenase family protein [Halococcus qingdaonensis]
MTREAIDYGRFETGRDVNYWKLDRTLQFEVRRTYPDEEFAWAEPRLSAFGDVVGSTVADNADRIDRHEPELHTYDEDGEVRNEVEYHPKQGENERIAYEEFGLTHDAFHAPPGREEPMGLTHTLTQQTLLSYADAGFVCPVSMTNGVALVLDEFDDGSLDDYFSRLTSRDADEHIEGAMFLTEKQGGSDVGTNETVAERADDGSYRLTGEKWFCSNIDAEGALALARRPDAPDGTAGLSLFLVPRTKSNGEVNDALFRRLKDKLGTLSVPTGEIEFRGTEASLVGEPENGFRQMTAMLNFERLSNAGAAVGIMGRALLESKIQAATREAFGEPIQEKPLMRRDLVDMSVDYEAAAAFTFECAGLLDSHRREEDREAFTLMRALVPIAKQVTARMAVETASYACEVLGGNGYVREHVTPRLLRDAQVLPIWEGTSNVLSLDLLRALDREDAHEALLPAIREHIDAVEHPALAECVETVDDEFTRLQEALVHLAGADVEEAQLQAKELAEYVFDVYTAALLLAEAQAELDRGDARKALVAERFVETRLRESDARGIADGDRFAIEHFDEIVRYAPVAPESLAESAPADD